MLRKQILVPGILALVIGVAYAYIRFNEPATRIGQSPSPAVAVSAWRPGQYMWPGPGEPPTPAGQIRPAVAAAARSLERELGARLGLTESQRAAFYRAQVEEYTNGWKDGKPVLQELAGQLTPTQALEFAKWGEEKHQKGVKDKNSQWLAQVERDLVLSPEQLSKLALKVDSRPEFPVPADVGVPWKEACQKQIDAELRLMSGIITSQQQAKYVDFRMNSPKSDCKLLESIHLKVGTQSSPN